jgi:hypothetical protein
MARLSSKKLGNTCDAEVFQVGSEAPEKGCDGSLVLIGRHLHRLVPPYGFLLGPQCRPDAVSCCLFPHGLNVCSATIPQ